MTTGPTTTEELDEPSNMRVYSREKIAERIGWGVAITLLCLAMVGAFGHGYLSRRIDREQTSGLAVEYSRIERHEAPAVLRITCPRPPAPEQKIRLRLTRSFLDQTTPSSVVPVPVLVEDAGSNVLVTFPIEQISDPQIEIQYRYRPHGVGQLHFSIGLIDQPGLALSQFILP